MPDDLNKHAPAEIMSMGFFSFFSRLLTSTTPGKWGATIWGHPYDVRDYYTSGAV